MVNKNFISLFLSIMLLFLISACSSDNSFEQSKTENSVSQWHHTVMSLNISKENFDAKRSAATRATSSKWNDGDKLYLRFVTYNGIVIGNATYDGSKGMWNVEYNGTLNKNVESQLFVVFLDNIENETLAQDDVIPLDCYHGVYMDEHGTYLYDPDNDIFTVNANLKSATSRVRFKGDTPNMDFKLIGVTYYVGYNPQNHTFTTSTDVVRSQTNENKESDYIYVQQLTEENRQIMLGRTYEEGNYIFKAICSKEMFVTGKSGILSMPSKTLYKGWNKKQVSGIDEDGHGWVDLDLPSGTIWAEENFGADQSKWQESGDGKYLVGNQCMWGSVDYTNWSQSTTDIGGTSEDIITMVWGEKWRTPSKKDFDELRKKDNIKSATTYDDYYNSGSVCKVKGVEIVGKNDEALFLLYSYRKDNHTYYSNGYWSSTSYNSSSANYLTSPALSITTGKKSGTKCIKPIMNK